MNKPKPIDISSLMMAFKICNHGKKHEPDMCMSCPYYGLKVNILYESTCIDRMNHDIEEWMEYYSYVHQFEKEKQYL